MSTKSGLFSLFIISLTHYTGLTTSIAACLVAFSVENLKSSATFFNFLIYPGRLKDR